MRALIPLLIAAFAALPARAADLVVSVTTRPHADLLVEAQHVNSKRNARRLSGEDPKQAQTVLQTAIRLSF